MENQVTRKPNSSGHEGHVCHKCGSVYPNPHPSAKHRRAHKRICGTIEGFKHGNADEKMTHLDRSDDEKQPVEEQQPQPSIPSVKMGESLASRRSGSGFGSISSARSEDDVFADAATDFSDSPGAGEFSDAVKEPLTVSKKISGDIVSDVNLTSVDASADTGSAVDNHHETTAIASAALDTGTREVTLGENVAASSVVSTEPDVDAKEIDQVETSTVPVSHLKETVEINTSGTLDADANINKELNPSVNNPEHETVPPEDAPEVYGTVGEKASGETSGSAGVTIEMSRGGLESLKDSNAVVDPIEESGSPIETSTLLEDGSGEADESVEMTEKSDKITGNDSVDFHVLKVPGDLPLREELDNLGEFKDHEPIKLCISLVHDASHATGLQFSEDDAMVQSQSAIQYKETGESTVGPKDEFTKDVTLLENAEGDDNLKPMVEGLPAALSSQESETKADEVSNMREICESTSQTVMPRGTELVTDNIGVHSVREHDSIEDAESYDAIKAASSNVAVDASRVNLAVLISSESLDATEAQGNQTSNVIGHGDEHHYENPGAAIVDSSRQEIVVGEVERSDASLAGNSSEPALVSSVSHNETYIQQELEAITENIPFVQTTGLHEDGDDEHECENAGARSLGSNRQELKSREEKFLDEINTRKLPVPAVTTPAMSESHDKGEEVIRVDSHHSSVASDNVSNHVTLSNVLENPSHPKDLLSTQDGAENVNSSDDKVLGAESVSPFDTSYVMHGGTNVLGDVTPISSSCADLDSTPRTVENLGKEVVGDDVGIIQNATFEGSCAKELSHDVSGVPNKSLQADIDDDGVAPAIDALVDCSSQTDSLEANWGSISDMEAILSSDSRATTEKQAGSLEPSMPVVQQIDKPEILDPPSFMKLVEPKIGGVRSEEASEIQTSKAPASDGSLQSGWFPSVSYGTSESPGRKRNEEIIAKVTNWSTSKQQHAVLKSLLGEAHDSSKENPPSPKEKDAIPVMKTGDLGTNVLGSRQQQTISEAVEAAAAKEWNSPARYPTNTKRGKGKSKSRSYWSPFVCCSSVQSS
ncbi:hypothetical protein Drorol1_Dr00009698 [Drosera rotundifolia]